MFRRLLLVAWIGSHQGVDIAAELGAGYTKDSCDLAESYLSRQLKGETPCSHRSPAAPWW